MTACLHHNKRDGDNDRCQGGASPSVDAGSVSLSPLGAKIQAKPICNANNGLHQPQMAASNADAYTIPSPVDRSAMFPTVCWHYRYQ